MSSPSPEALPAVPAHRRLAPQLGTMALVAAAYYLLVEWSFPTLAEFDAFYNVAIARIYLHHGFIRSFPWMQLSILRDRFADPQLLLHLAAMPGLALGLDPTTVGKLVAAGSATAMAVTFHWLLARQRIRWSVAWTLVLLGASSYCIARLSFVRSTALFLTLLFLFVDALFEARSRRLFLVSALAVWTYQGFPLLLVLALLWLGARALLGEDRFRFELLRPIIGGFLVGLVVNPFFPNDLGFLHAEIIEHLLMRPKEVVLTSEWNPIDTARYFAVAFVPLAALVTAELVGAAARVTLDARLLVVRVVAALLFFGSLLSLRVLEYFTPWALLSAALTISRALESRSDGRPWLRAAWGVGLFVCLPAAVLNVKDGIRLSSGIATEMRPDDYARVAAWLTEHSDEGELVVTQWDDFPMMFFYDSKNRYLYGLNPLYGHGADERRYTVHSLLYEGRVADPESFLADLGARWLLVARADRYPARRELLRMLGANPRFEEVLAVHDTHLFKLRPAEPATAPPP